MKKSRRKNKKARRKNKAEPELSSTRRNSSGCTVAQPIASSLYTEKKATLKELMRCGPSLIDMWKPFTADDKREWEFIKQFYFPNK